MPVPHTLITVVKLFDSWAVISGPQKEVSRRACLFESSPNLLPCYSKRPPDHAF